MTLDGDGEFRIRIDSGSDFLQRLCFISDHSIRSVQTAIQKEPHVLAKSTHLVIGGAEYRWKRGKGLANLIWCRLGGLMCRRRWVKCAQVGHDLICGSDRMFLQESRACATEGQLLDEGANSGNCCVRKRVTIIGWR